jgi:hypothetical protein
MDIDSRWNWLYKVAGTAALITVAFIPIQMVLFIAWPPPGFEPNSNTVIGWFTLFHHHRLLGLIQLDLLLIVDQVLAIPIVLALYVALRRASESIMAIATALGLVAVAAYLASNTAFPMLSLSERYAAATTNEQRSMFVAAGQAMLALYSGTAFQVSYVLGSVVLVITAVVMLRSHIFSKATAYAGILSSVIGLGLFVPKIGLVLALISVPFLAIWDILIARRFFQLGQFRATETP